MQMCLMGKNPNNYENIRKETNIYEQKPVILMTLTILKRPILNIESKKEKTSKEKWPKITNF